MSERNFRSITEVEEITDIPETAKIPVVVDGQMKQISKENAKFGGGGGAAYYLNPDDSYPFFVYTDAEYATKAYYDDFKNLVASGVVPMFVLPMHNGAVTYVFGTQVMFNDEYKMIELQMMGNSQEFAFADSIVDY